MKLEEIIPGKIYRVKTEVSGAMEVVVNKRDNDLIYPFECTAANFGIVPKEIIVEIP